MLKRVPTAAWVCALVACLNAVCWSFLTPPFQAPDEPDHFAYTEQLARTATLPSSNAEIHAADETLILEDLRQVEVHLEPEDHPIASSAEQQTLEEGLARSAHLSQPNTDTAGVAASQPPLYYMLETIPYAFGSGGNLLDRLQLMRLLSALMGGLTALFTFLFVRELLPGVRWAWSVGGLGVALAPSLGFITGAVNPDGMLFAVSAALFFCIARSFKLGLTTKRAVAIGAMTGVGSLTKVTFLGLVPGVVLALVALSIRRARTNGPGAYLSLALALALAAGSAYVYALIDAASHRSAFAAVSNGVSTATPQGSVLDDLSYIWQLYLPRLPGMTNDFPGIFTAREIWFNGFVGLYGWQDTTFPSWICELALVPAGIIAALFIRALLAGRKAVMSRIAELILYAAMAIGVMGLAGAASYRGFPHFLAVFSQPRYLLPAVPLMGAVLALGARGAGRRWGPAAGALIVVLFFAHDLFSQLQVIARYYG